MRRMIVTSSMTALAGANACSTVRAKFRCPVVRR